MFAANSYGYIPGKQREFAVLHMRVARWRVLRINFGILSVFWDMTNAFPSMAQGPLDQVVFNCVPDPIHSWLLQGRHRRAIMVLKDSAGEAVAMRLLPGDRQGDVPTAQSFILAFDPALDQLNHALHSILDYCCLSFVDQSVVNIRMQQL